MKSKVIIKGKNKLINKYKLFVIESDQAAEESFPHEILQIDLSLMSVECYGDDL